MSGLTGPQDAWEGAVEGIPMGDTAPPTPDFVPAEGTVPDAQGGGVPVDGAGSPLALPPPSGDADYKPGDQTPPTPQAVDTDQARLGQLRQDDYTRKTQELADERRQIAAEREQLLDLMKRQQAPPDQKPGTVYDLLPPSTRESLPVEAKQTLEALDTVVSARIEQALSQSRPGPDPGPELEQRLAQLEQVSRQARDQQLNQRLGVEATAARGRYGAKLFDQYAPQVAQVLDQDIRMCEQAGSIPAMTVEQALMRVAPQAVQLHWMTMGKERALGQNQQRNANAVHGGGPPGPTAPSTPEYKGDESMAKSMAAVLGGLPMPSE